MLENDKKVRENLTPVIKEELGIYPNEHFMFDLIDDSAMIHIPPSRDVDLITLYNELKKGFQTLAWYIEDKDHITKVIGESWITTQHPKFVKRLGFTVEPAIGEHEAIAIISKEEFIKKYLKEE